MSTVQQPSTGTDAQHEQIDRALDIAGTAAIERGATTTSVLDWKRQMRRNLGPRFFEQSAEGRSETLRQFEPRPGDEGTRAAFAVLHAIAQSL